VCSGGERAWQRLQVTKKIRLTLRGKRIVGEQRISEEGKIVFKGLGGYSWMK